MIKLIDGFYISPTVNYSLRHICTLNQNVVPPPHWPYSGIPIEIDSVECNQCGTKITKKVRVMHKLWELTK